MIFHAISLLHILSKNSSEYAFNPSSGDISTNMIRHGIVQSAQVLPIQKWNHILQQELAWNVACHSKYLPTAVALPATLGGITQVSQLEPKANQLQICTAEMGQVMSCSCLEGIMSEVESKAARERVQALQIGSKFMRSAFMGLTSQELFVKLSDDTSRLQWKTTVNTWTKEEFGEIDLTTQVKSLKPNGTQGLQVVGTDGKPFFEITSEDPKLRDQWIIALNELLQDWDSHPDTKPQSSLSAGGTSNKAEYFKQREADIQAKEKLNAEKKLKYAAGGMKYTAQAMANRA